MIDGIRYLFLSSDFDLTTDREDDSKKLFTRIISFDINHIYSLSQILTLNI